MVAHRRGAARDAVAARVVRALVQRHQHVHVVARIGAEVVPLVLAHPAAREVLGGRRAAVLDADGRLLVLLIDAGHAGVVAEVRAHEPAVERPVVLRVRCGVHARVAAAAADVGLEGGLLRGVQDVAGRAQEDHDVVLREVLLGERRGVLRRVHREVVADRQLGDRHRARRDALRVPERRRLAEDERTEARLVIASSLCARRRGGREDRRARHRRQHQCSNRPTHCPALPSTWPLAPSGFHPAGPASSPPDRGGQNATRCLGGGSA